MTRRLAADPQLRAQWRRGSRSVARPDVRPMTEAGLRASQVSVLVQEWLSAHRAHVRGSENANESAWQRLLDRPRPQTRSDWSHDWRSGGDRRRLYLDGGDWEWRVDYNPANGGHTVGRISLHHLYTNYEPQLGHGPRPCTSQPSTRC